MALCTCPPAATPPAIPSQDCPTWIQQIQKFALQRGGNPWTGIDIGLLADWTTLLAAVDSSKIVVGPFINSPEIVAGDAITEGGDNTTLNGVIEVVGVNATSVTMVGKNLKPEVEKALKAYMCETNLVWYPFTSDGKIVHSNDGADDIGLPVQGLFVSDRNVPGFGAKNFVTITLQMPSGWSDDLVVTTPTDFNPLTDL